MSGYFSRIAKQSGIRFSKAGDRHAGAMKDRGERRPMPIDREETVMVSPPALVGPDRPERKSSSPDMASPRESSRRPVSVESTDAFRTEASRRPSAAAESLPREPVIEEVKLVATESSDSSPVEEDSLPLAGTDRDPIRQGPRRRAQKPISKEKRQTDTANTEVPDKDFFERTSEIIQGREAEPSTVQSILIQEVQEWIAAGRIPTDDIMLDQDVESPIPDETPPKVEHNPGVIRIGDRRRPDMRRDREEELSSSSGEIQEQNFEISIGSISVVIDGDDPVSQPAPAVAAPPSSPSGTPRRTSRLSRNYL
jgi:hypothetical protein